MYFITAWVDLDQTLNVWRNNDHGVVILRKSTNYKYKKPYFIGAQIPHQHIFSFLIIINEKILIKIGNDRYTLHQKKVKTDVSIGLRK